MHYFNKLTRSVAQKFASHNQNSDEYKHKLEKKSGKSSGLGQKLTHWGQMTHTCGGNLTIGSDNGLSPGWRQAIIGNNAGIFLIGPLEINFQQNFIQNSNIFIQEKCIWKYRLRNGSHFVSASMCC